MTRRCGGGGVIDRLGVGFGEGAEGGEEFGDPGFGGFGFVSRDSGGLEVRAGGLQGIEKQAGLALVETAVEEAVDGLHEGDLDGVGVLEYGELQVLVSLVEVALALGAGTFAFLGFGVEVAVAMMLECGRAAGFSVDLEVPAELDGRHWGTPYTRRIFGINE